MFDDFDYKKGAKGAGGLLKGVVKAISPESGTGMDEAGGGLGQILAAAGVELGEDEAPKEAPKPAQKSTARKFDEHDFAPRREKTKAPETAQEPEAREPSEGQPTDREITAALLRERGWSEDEIAKILAGPTTEAKRVSEAKAGRIDGEDATTDERAAISNAAAPARRVQPVKAKRITK